MEGYTEPVTLQGEAIRLEPLSQDHAEGLFHASKDPQIWEWLTRPAFADIKDVRHWIQLANHMQAIGDQLPFAIISNENGLAIGSSRYLNIHQDNKSLEIGWTFLAPKFWGTPVNPEVKYLLLNHAFQTLNAYRVQFAIDSRNLRSQKALLRLGAKQEGTIRSERINYDGYRRDSVYFSILDHEWGDIQIKLQDLLHI